MGWIGGFARLTQLEHPRQRWAHANNTAQHYRAVGRGSGDSINIAGNLRVDPREHTAARQDGQQPPRTEDTTDSTDDHS